MKIAFLGAGSTVFAKIVLGDCLLDENLPEFYLSRLNEDDIDTVLCDYISGMSDMYAVKTFKEIFVPKNCKL